LRQLEDWLGEPLIRREGNRLALTDNGKAYHQRISGALGEIAMATIEFQGLSKSGYLRLSCVPGLSIQWLSRQLADFEEIHPEFSIDLRPTDDAPDLLAHEIDADVRFYRDSDGSIVMPKGIRETELTRPTEIAVASPALAARIVAHGSVRALLDENLLHGKTKEDWRIWLEQQGVDTPSEVPGRLSYHAHLAISSARMGRGVALANRYLVGEDLARGELVEVRFDDTRPVVLGSYSLIAREDRWSTPVLAALRRFLRDRAKAPRVAATDGAV
jgi:DNA-binding transcriptional LysR family regulator